MACWVQQMRHSVSRVEDADLHPLIRVRARDPPCALLPVLAADGHVYGRVGLTRWIEDLQKEGKPIVSPRETQADADGVITRTPMGPEISVASEIVDLINNARAAAKQGVGELEKQFQTSTPDNSEVLIKQIDELGKTCVDGVRTAPLEPGGPGEATPD